MGYKLDKTLLINIIPHSALKNHAVKSNPLTNEPQKIATLLACFGQYCSNIKS